jgi:nucleoside-triphosphatase
MNNASVVVLTGEVQTGKTTALLNWCEGKRITGFATPVVNGLRVVRPLPDGECLPFEITGASADGVSIGRYHLSLQALVEMNKLLKQACFENADWIVVDEVGPLELREQGLYAGVVHVLRHAKGNILLVVRKSILDEVIATFQLTDSRVITIENLNELRSR